MTTLHYVQDGAEEPQRNEKRFYYTHYVQDGAEEPTNDVEVRVYCLSISYST